MGLFLDAAYAWNALCNVYYILDVARKGKLGRIELKFLNEDFPHLAGMQYASDVDFGLRKAEYYGGKLVPALISKRMNDIPIQTSRNWIQISGRLMALINLEKILDNDFIIVSFNNQKVKGYSQIDAKYAIKSGISNDTYFIFFDKQSGRYFCKSAFKKGSVDYIENQSKMTLLQKTKVVNSFTNILYTKNGYTPQ